jgi:dihydroflavonol-4-reductase
VSILRVLVTGASGFIGLNVVEALSVAGHETRAYTRASSNLRYLASLPAEVRTGELHDGARLREAMEGVDAVIHCASRAGFSEADEALLRETNVEGTRAVVDAAVDAGVQRFVLTSTTATIGSHDDPTRQWNEDTPLVGARAATPYARTKAEAESIVRAAIVRGLDAIVLNPAEVIGAWDHRMHWGRMILAVASGRIPFVPLGMGSFCSAREVGRAHVAALTRGATGARYVLAGTDSTYRDLVDTIVRVAGLPAASEPEPEPVDPYRWRLYAGHFKFDSSRAVRDLGHGIVPLADMVREAYDWYRRSGFLPLPFA